jgi:hypothetical protein
MSHALTIPKKGDLVVCINEGYMGAPNAGALIHAGEVGLVTFVRNTAENVGYMHVTWFNGEKTKHHLHGRWASLVGGWKKWLRVVEHKT